jgi:hypothetical protein
VGPRACLDTMEKVKSLAPTGNRTSAVQPVTVAPFLNGREDRSGFFHISTQIQNRGELMLQIVYSYV